MQLSANLTWLYPNLDWDARFHAAAIDGFAGAEILLPYDQSPPWYAAQLRSAGLELTLTDRLTLLASGGYDWVEGHEFAIGADRIDVDLDGWRAALALGWSFGGR